MDFKAYLDGFPSNVQDILDNFEFRNQIPLQEKGSIETFLQREALPYADDAPMQGCL